jgi:hypothetical protein
MSAPSLTKHLGALRAGAFPRRPPLAFLSFPSLPRPLPVASFLSPTHNPTLPHPSAFTEGGVGA